jgi:hypothetical protein
MCAFKLMLLSRCMPTYFAAADDGIYCSNDLSLFLGTCLIFVNIIAVLLSLLPFTFNVYSHD